MEQGKGHQTKEYYRQGSHAEVIQTEEKNTTKFMAKELNSMDPGNTDITRMMPVHPNEVVRHVSVLVVNVEGDLESDKDAPAYSVEVSVCNKSQETEKSKTKEWNDVFRFELTREPIENHITTRSRDFITFVLKDLSHFKTRIIGKVKFCLEDVMPESLTEITKGFCLTNKKGKEIDDKESDSIKITFRVNIESLPHEDRHLAAGPLSVPSNLCVTYPDLHVTFKAGDVILYSMPGPLGSLLKLKYNTAWSHCGIVVELPNKWTGEPQLYVLEYTRNVERFFDSYSEMVLENGPLLFKLEERIYGAPGTEIWVMPLKESVVKHDTVAEISSYVVKLREKLIEGIKEGKDGKGAQVYKSDSISWSVTESAYMKNIKIDLSNTCDYCEVFSPQLCKTLLKESLDLELPGIFTIRSIVQSKASKRIFEPPFLIRCRQEYRHNISWPSPIGTSGPKKDKHASDSGDGTLKYVDDVSSSVIPKIQPCIGVVGQKEALDQIQLINYFLYAEEQAFVVLDGIICNWDGDILSRAEDVDKKFRKNKKGFTKLLNVIVKEHKTLNVDQLKDADELVSKHNDYWKELEFLINDASKTNKPIMIQSLKDEEINLNGNAQMGILSYLITYEEKALELLEEIQSGVPQEKMKQYRQVRERIVDLYKKINIIREEMIKSEKILNELRLAEATKFANEHKVAWIEFEKFILEMAKYQV